MERTEGYFTYPLDDTYIHLAIADQVLETGNWGPSPFQFQFSSSSPAFTLLLSLLGFADTWAPLLLNLLFGLLWIWVVSGLGLVFEASLPRLFLLLALAILLIPLHLLSLLGMEHLAHLFFSTLFLREASRKLSQPQLHPSGLLILSAMAMCLFRYEGLFLLAGFGQVALWQKSWKTLAITSLGALFPLFVIGIYMLSQGGSFFPISILGKAQGIDLLEAEFASWIVKAASNLYENPFILILLLANLCLLLFNLGKRQSLWTWMWTLATLMHILFAEIGGYRYEAYLVGLGLLNIILSRPKNRDLPIFSLAQQQVMVLIFALALFPFFSRSLFFSLSYPTFVQNIYQQPIQTGRFLRTHYYKSSVALNDIGAGSYFGKVKLTDMVGIGDQKVFNLRKQDRYRKNLIEILCEERETEIAIVHYIWVEEVIPESWVAVGQLTILQNMICADKTLTFYACKPSEIPRLKNKLIRFSESLPEGIKAEILLVE